MIGPCIDPARTGGTAGRIGEHAATLSDSRQTDIPSTPSRIEPTRGAAGELVPLPDRQRIDEARIEGVRDIVIPASTLPIGLVKGLPLTEILSVDFENV